MHRQPIVVDVHREKNVMTEEEAALYAAFMKKYVQQWTLVIIVRGIETLAAPRKLAQKMEIGNLREEWCVAVAIPPLFIIIVRR